MSDSLADAQFVVDAPQGSDVIFRQHKGSVLGQSTFPDPFVCLSIVKQTSSPMYIIFTSLYGVQMKEKIGLPIIFAVLFPFYCSRYRAFDYVYRDGIVFKLQSFGFNSQTYKMATMFLGGHFYRIRVGGDSLTAVHL